MATDFTVKARLSKGLDLGSAEDRAIFRQRVAADYGMMKLSALRKEAGLPSSATRYDCERAVAEKLLRQ